VGSRADSKEAFLQRAGWRDARRTPLAGDASNRSYERLSLHGDRAVLMDSPPPPAEPTKAFCRIDAHLRACGFSAPEILAHDPLNGFVLLEDLGDAIFARAITNDPRLERPLYEAAVDTLIELHRQTLPADTGRYGPGMMAQYIAPCFEWYVRPGAEDVALNAAIYAELETVLSAFWHQTDTLILRDFHAENLIWLPDRHGVRRVGLLDFQDALAGHRAYDLASLLGDARRDVAPELAAAMTARYVCATQVDGDSFGAALAVQSVQRNLRILGVFSRLARQDAKPQYLQLIPRVWGYLLRDLAHPELHALRADVLRALPAPASAHLDWLQSA